MEKEAKVRFGTLVGIAGAGPFPTLFNVTIEEDETGELFSFYVPNQQSCHPIGDLADVKRERLGLPTGQFCGAQVDVRGEPVAFVECVDDFGFVGSLIARETFDAYAAEAPDG